MAKKISLQLEINGVKQSVSSISDLETQIRKMKTQLEGLDIGSQEFQKLSGEIRKAQNFAEDLNESLKPQELEKRVGAYAKVGSAIVSSFAAAQSAIALFGNESEEIAQAAAKAQAVLTIALTAREVAEGAVALKTVAANIATAASAAAANTANVATKALYTTIAANPYGALLAALGAVVGAVIYFTGETEKQVDVVKEATAVVSQESTELSSQLIILQSLNTGNAVRVQTLEKLKKEYPGFNAFIDEENRLTQEGVRFLELRIKQLVIEARTKAIVNRINAESQKILELQNTDVLASITLWDRLVNSLKSVGNLGNPLPEVEAIQNQNAEIAQSEKNIVNLTNALIEENKTLNTVLEQQKQYNDKLQQTNDQEVKAAENKRKVAQTQEQVNDAYKKGLTATVDLSGAIKQLNDSLLKYEGTINKLGTLQYEAPILERLKKIKEARSAAAKELTTDIKRIQESIASLAPQGVGVDPLINIFKTLREKLEQEFGKIGTAQFEGFQKIYETFVRDNISLSQEQKNILTDVIQGYSDLSKLLTEAPGFTQYIQTLKGINVEWDNFRASQTGVQDATYNGAVALAAIIGDITAANKQFFLEFKQEAGGLNNILNQISDDVVPIEPIKFDPIKAKENAAKYIKELETALFKPVATRLLQLELKTQQEALKIATDPVRKGEIEGYIKNITEQIGIVNQTGQLAARLTQTTGEQVRAEVGQITKTFLDLSSAIVSAEQKIFLVNQEFNKLKTSLNPEELSRAIGATVLQNIDAISELLLGARTKEKKLEKEFIDGLKNDRAGLEDFKKQLILKGVDVEKASYEDLLQAYIAYKKKEVDVTKKADSEKKQSTTDTLNEIVKYLQTFSQGLNQAATLSRESIQNQLDFLQKSTDATLANIVGDTESAERKREEIRQEYAEKRKELEKKQAISSLKFSLVQSIANAAQAITSIFAQLGGTPLAFIQSAIVAGLTTAEIAIINEQINMAQMFRRGGLTKAQGGMLLSGPTHEQGGIPLAQMGVIAEGQEAIINRNSLINFRDLLSTVNQAGGGRPLVVNSFDDTRIVEAIAEQRQKPLRAYVLQSEITNEQALSKRLDDLSKI